MKKTVTILFSLLIFLTVPTNAQNSLKGDWQLVSMIDENSVEVSLPEKIKPTVEFENSSVRARFCNSISGKYTLNKQKIKIKMNLSTMMYCRELKTEQLFSKLLGSAASFSVKKHELTLMGNKGKPTLKFRKKAPEETVSLNGKWQLTSMILGKDGAVPLIGKPITLNIDNDRIGGNGGCNSYGGEFIQGEETVKFADIISTRMWCENAPTESKYLQALEKSILFELSGNELVLMDADKQNILKFTKMK